VKKRTKLRLVSKGEREATGIFDDLDKLRAETTGVVASGVTPTTTPAKSESSLKVRRERETETFARFPHDRALKLYRHIGGVPWAALIELDRMIIAKRGENPVVFWSPRLRHLGLTSQIRTRALQQLEAAGVVKVERRGRGLAHLVTHLWYPLQGGGRG
jgi:hypothetical protein